MKRDPHVDKLINDLKAKKFREGEAKELTNTYGAEISKQLTPLFSEHSKAITDKITDAVLQALKGIKVDVPETKFPEIPQPVVNVPAPVVNVKAPIINVPAPIVNMPEIKFPEQKPFPTEFSLRGITKKTPLYVQTVDMAGNPYFPTSGVSTGGKGDFFTMLDILNSIRVVMVDPDGNPYYPTGGSSSGSTTVSLVNTDGLYYNSGNPFPVTAVVSNIFGSTGANIVNPDGRIKVELPATTLAVSGITATIASANVDSTGVQYSGSNPMPTYLVATSGNSTISVGDLASDAADTGSAPVKIGGIARTANPTAVAAGDRVSATFDDLGRQITRPLQVRDLTLTAYATLNTNTETTLLAAVAGSFLDLVWIKFSNTSTGAVTIDVRDSTAGSIVDTWEVPATSVVGIAPALPYPQGNTGNNWTIDFNDSDISNTTIYVSGLFVREI